MPSARTPPRRPPPEWRRTSSPTYPRSARSSSNGSTAAPSPPPTSTTARPWSRWPQTCRQLHAGPRFATDFDMFDVQRRYLDLVMRERVPAAGGIPRLHADRRGDARRARAYAPRAPCPATTTCWPQTSWRATDRLWFIDYEYSGNGDPCFELGNLCSESHLGTERLDRAGRGLLRRREAGQGRPRPAARR